MFRGLQRASCSVLLAAWELGFFGPISQISLLEVKRLAGSQASGVGRGAPGLGFLCISISPTLLSDLGLQL